MLIHYLHQQCTHFHFPNHYQHLMILFSVALPITKPSDHVM